jgi:hypothetical protein
MYSLLLGLVPAVWAMEETEVAATGEARQPLGERQIDVNRFAGRKVVYESCLNIDAKDGYSLEETLKIRRNCLKGFVEEHIKDIKSLGRLGLFVGQITSYNEEAMTILRRIFSNDGDKENLPGSISSDFLRHSTDFFKDLDDLRTLIKDKDTQPTEIKNILEEMHKHFHFVNWMATYYWNHHDEYRRLHPVS